VNATPLSPVLQPGTVTNEYHPAVNFGDMNTHVLSDGVIGAAVVSGDPAGGYYVGFRGLGPVAVSSDLSNPNAMQLLELGTGSRVASGLVPQGGFETPQVGSGNFQSNPKESLWKFVGSSGLAGNDSGYTLTNPNAPEGSQVAYLQG